MIPHLEDIIAYCLEEYPLEACGVLCSKGPEVTWLPCDNHSDKPTESFKFNSVQYIRILMSTDSIQAIVHSHPSDDCTPSEHDRKACDLLGIPYLIIACPSGNYTLLEPSNV